MDCDNRNELLVNIDKLHTTDLGVVRIKKNLTLDTDDVVAWCRAVIENVNTGITRKGKNWYAENEACIITVNAFSYTIITAHKRSADPKNKQQQDLLQRAKEHDCHSI